MELSLTALTSRVCGPAPRRAAAIAAAAPLGEGGGASLLPTTAMKCSRADNAGEDEEASVMASGAGLECSLLQRRHERGEHIDGARGVGGSGSMVF